MELEYGKTYKSPRHGRRIRIQDVEDLGDYLVIAIYWVEDDSGDNEADQIKVSKEDVKDWKLVN